MGRTTARLIAPALFACSLLPAVEQPPMMGVVIGDGARLVQRWNASLYAKLWNERSLEPVRTLVAQQLAGLESAAGFTVLDALTAMKSTDIRVTGFLPDPKGGTNPQAQVLAQIDAGPFATRLLDLFNDNPQAQAITVPGADRAISMPSDDPALEHMTVSRFGERLLVELNREEPSRPYDVAPVATDVRFTMNYRTFFTAMKDLGGDPKTTATFTTVLQKFDRYLEPLTWELSLVPEGLHERMSQPIRYPGTLPVDRSLFARLPANTLMAVAMGLDSQAYWQELEPMLENFTADLDQPLTGAQVREQLEIALADAGLPLKADEVFKGLTGTVLMAVTPAAPFPAVTIAVPRSPALDQALRFALTSRLMVEAPTDGSSAPVPIPNLPLPITLIADAKYWVVTSDQTLAGTWFTPGEQNWSTSPAVKTAIAKAAPDAFLIGASDTPAVLRTLGGFLPLLPIQDPKVKQTITVLLARASAAAATGFLLGQFRKDGWEMEARGLLGMTAMPAVLAGAAVGATRSMRGGAGGDAAVVTALRSGVFPAQIQFQAGGYLDQNGDNIGEYGFFNELAGDAITGQPDSLRLSFLPNEWKSAQPTLHGYRFSCWLPDGKGGALAGGVGARAQNAAAAKAQGERFVVYAWPADGGDRPVFALTQSGTIYSSTEVEAGPQGPVWNALFGDAGWDDDPVWQPYRRR